MSFSLFTFPILTWINFEMFVISVNCCIPTKNVPLKKCFLIIFSFIICFYFYIFLHYLDTFSAVERLILHSLKCWLFIDCFNRVIKVWFGQLQVDCQFIGMHLFQFIADVCRFYIERWNLISSSFYKKMNSKYVWMMEMIYNDYTYSKKPYMVVMYWFYKAHNYYDPIIGNTCAKF